VETYICAYDHISIKSSENEKHYRQQLYRKFKKKKAFYVQ